MPFPFLCCKTIYVRNRVLIKFTGRNEYDTAIYMG